MGDLQIDRLCVEFGKRRVLDSVTFSARPGQVCGVLGPNGAGKTTLLRAALGLVPYAGSVCLGGTELGRLSELQRAKHAAYVPQRSLLSAPLSVLQVVEQGRYAHQPGRARLTASDRQAVERALEDCDLQTFEDRRFTQLSGGEQRRVLLARALATEAPLVLLDEPTSGLDIPHALRFCRRVRALAASGRTVLVVLHDLDEARRMCDRALLLLHGSVYREGSVDECISDAPILDVFGVRLLPGAGLGYELPEHGD